MINLNDVVKYKTPINPNGFWGRVVEILKIEKSVHQSCNESKVYRIEPLSDRTSVTDIVPEADIVEVYSLTFRKKD